MSLRIWIGVNCSHDHEKKIEKFKKLMYQNRLGNLIETNKDFWHNFSSKVEIEELQWYGVEKFVLLLASILKYMLEISFNYVRNWNLPRRFEIVHRNFCLNLKWSCCGNCETEKKIKHISYIMRINIKSW